jgi:hypothetical protein
MIKLKILKYRWQRVIVSGVFNFFLQLLKKQYCVSESGAVCLPLAPLLALEDENFQLLKKSTAPVEVTCLPLAPLLALEDGRDEILKKTKDVTRNGVFA